MQNRHKKGGLVEKVVAAIVLVTAGGFAICGLLFGIYCGLKALAFKV